MTSDTPKRWNLFSSTDVTDIQKTTAELEVGSLKEDGIALTHDSPWEGDHCCYHNFFEDDGLYRMYYLAHRSDQAYTEVKVCYAVSGDGLRWEKPALGLVEFNGNTENNIILDKRVLEPGGFFDNFFVYKDKNPKCESDKRYKALAYTHEYRFSCWFSTDGIRFTYGYEIKVPGRFDTLNTCFWDAASDTYVAHIRDFHDIPPDGDLNRGIRDIRRMQSKDFIHWTTPERIRFNSGAADYPLYTNQIMQYCRNDRFYIGFATRYVERAEWTPAFEELCGRELRLKRMEQHPRLGLAITDCVFMSSADGRNWDRIEEAFITPGEEKADNWVYGDGYPAYGMVQKKNSEGHDRLYMLMQSGHNCGGNSVLKRHSIRPDGFACYRAARGEKRLTTMPFLFDGTELFMNFSTSAKGYIYVTLKGADGYAESCEMFGDSSARKVCFKAADLEKLRGKTVTAEFKMCDARLFSFAVL